MDVERSTRLSYLLSHYKLLLNLMLPMLNMWTARAILEAALVLKVTTRVHLHIHKCTQLLLTP